jgi:hypothetical protein
MEVFYKHVNETLGHMNTENFLISWIFVNFYRNVLHFGDDEVMCIS